MKLLFIFLTLFLISKEESKIRIIINGFGHLYFISESFYLSPDEVFMQGNSIGQHIKSFNFNGNIPHEIIIIFNEQIESFANMFSGLNNILSIDLSKFDSSKVTDMSFMFNECPNLKTITFGNLDTSKVNNMESLFQGCKKLSELNVSSFDTSLVTNMGSMFRFCESLTSLDVTNFNTKKVENMLDMFGYCKELFSINVSNFITSNVHNMKGMFYLLEKLEYLDLSNFNTSSVTTIEALFGYSESLTFINMYSFKINNDVNIDKAFISSNERSNLKICINNIETLKKLQKQEINNCKDICLSKNLKIIKKYLTCIDDCTKSEFKYEFNNYCLDICPEETYVSDSIEYKCLLKNSEDTYYFDNNKKVFKKCYKTCKECSTGGTEINHNCIQCKDGFTFLSDSQFIKNCKKQCKEYSYNEGNDYILSEKCPEKYNKLIEEECKCIDKCENDNKYKYEYNNKCYEDCPVGTYKNGNNCITNEEDKNIKIFQNYIINSDIPKNVIESKKDYIEIQNDTIYQISTTENQRNNKYRNISTINFDNCEKILRNKYNINDSLPLIILKIDYKPPDLLIPIIGYEIYELINKTKLNLDECKDIKLDIPVSINEDELFKYDPNSDFYNDDCFSYTTNNGTDIILNDRKQEYIDKNLSLCENNCEYIGYSKS